MTNSTVSFLTVTCKTDFPLLNRLLASSEKHTSKNNFIHYIVLNDAIEHKDELESIVENFKNIICKIYHFHDIPGMDAPLRDDYKYGFRYTDGWVTQQILTLTAAQKIETEYYCNINSKDYFIRDISIENIISKQGIECTAEKFNNFIPQHGTVSYMFLCHYVNSYKIFELSPWDYCDKAIMPHTPATLATKHVQSMLDYFYKQDISILDLIGHNNTPLTPEVKETNKTNEYYLYSAWLAKNNLLNTISWKHNSYYLRDYVMFSKDITIQT